ncbi:MAG TPA: hypothetical protein VFL30_08280 [Rhodanobacteraceae bacterium]|nr:hypothetical protein [Rhodanobacteraceae bacterium]
MMHDDLVRHFERQPRPTLSGEFAANLHARVHALDRPSALAVAARRWVPRLYWVVAAAMLAAYWPSVPLTLVQIALLVASAALVVRAVQRALHAPPLARVLHEALWR